MKNDFKIGDVISIEKGMKIYAYIPRKFINDDFPFSIARSFIEITVGTIYQQRKFSKKELIAEFNTHTKDFMNFSDSDYEDIVNSYPKLLETSYLDTSSFIGQYEITSIGMEKTGSKYIFARKLPQKDCTIRLYF